MVASQLSSRIQALVLSSFCFSLLAHHGNSLSFTFNFTDAKYQNSLNAYNITTDGDASYNTDHLSLSKDSALGIGSSSGRATYTHPMLLWNNKTGEVTNFTTNFSFLIQNTTVGNFGDGLAFFLSSSAQLPPNSAGGNLGLFNYSKNLNASANHLVAVEFDTFINGAWDPNSTDLTDCHIGIDVNKIKSSEYKIIPNSLFVGKRMSAWINYNSATTNLTLYLSHADDPRINFSLNARVDLKNSLPEEVVVGFSASTGQSIELHQINSWSFNSTLEEDFKSHKKTLSISIVGVIASAVLILLILVGLLVCCLRKKALSKKNNEIEMHYDDLIESEFDKGRGPRKFSYDELVAATEGFAEDKKLGEGGFGSVFRGVLRDGGIQVAVKKVAKGSKQGKKEYISEVKIISRLRHRNLVQLIGWCHEQGDFLLVYELMANGSLDRPLHNPERVLTWSMLHKIALGVGSALSYLHTEWEQCVVHRDIKPSNIMLDSLFNAKLGDFGLARLIDHESESQPTIPAGTMGYMAPECVMTGTASSESDVYSFGIVLLEITCGRSPIVLHEDQHKVRLVEWVWDMYGCGSILEAMDKRLKLNGEAEEREVECLMVVGLWCAHPIYTLRPSIKQAMRTLNFEEPLPTLPPKMPVPIYAAPAYSSMSPYTSSTGFGTSTAGTSSSSKTTSTSSDSSWLLKQSGTM
ncbi:hypothetical protein LUZ60_000618 [Juncus effusus]|nr:hypothetical protein LUZ60_000618 [Juncus effusus]